MPQHEGTPRLKGIINTINNIQAEADTSYNVLITHSALNALGTIVSTPHLVMKFPFSNGQLMIIKVVTRPPKEDNVSAYVKISIDVELDPKPPIDQGAEPTNKLENIPLINDEHHTQIGCKGPIENS
ncbi:hypothetical protein CR513_57427, partial [Mucuna pruriens]